MTADDIKKYTSLLDEFQKVPIKKRNKTFMGVCQYPFSRFEEICSRVLAYYFNPEEDHGFRDLWLRAFVQSLNDPTNEEVIASVRARVNEKMKDYPLFAY